MNDENKFWGAPGRWPDDAMGYVFLANAVNRVGKFLFPIDWDGNENCTESLYNFWQEIDGKTGRLAEFEAMPHQRLDIHRLLAMYRPEFGRTLTIERGPFGPKIPEFSSAEWNAGIDEAERLNAERLPKLTRKAEVRRYIKKAILNGSLRYVLLPKAGGAFSDPQDRSWWNVKDHDRLFFWCQMNPKNPTGIAVGGDDFQHIFVDESDLESLTGTNAKAEQQADFTGDPYAGIISGLQELPNFPEKLFSDPRDTPDPADFVVMEMDDWTIEMALVWCIWRDPMQVIRFDRDFHQLVKLTELQFDSILEPTLAGIRELLASNPGVDGLSYDTALRRLRSAFRSGHLVADATDLQSMEVKAISANEWKRLTPVSGGGTQTVLANNLGVAVYGDVMVERAAVLSLWPPSDAIQGNGSVELMETADVERKTMLEKIRAVGVLKLSPSERQIWKAIEAIGGENGLPPRRVDYKELIKDNVLGTPPSDSSIDRFFARFKPAD